MPVSFPRNAGSTFVTASAAPVEAAPPPPPPKSNLPHLDTPLVGRDEELAAVEELLRQASAQLITLTGLGGTGKTRLALRAAEEAGIDPKTFVDRLVEEDWRPLPGRVGATPDFFIRTTDEGHHRFVQEFVQRIYDNGHIYEDIYAGLYCVGHEAFLTEDELTPDGLCPEHGTRPETIEERNWFFRLSAFQEQLLRMAMVVANFSGGEAEEPRRAMGFKRSARRMQQIERGTAARR